MATTRADGDSTVDVAAVLDAAPLRTRQIGVILLALLAMVLDGFDIQSVSFAAPALAGEWGLSRTLLGPVLATGLIGMALGGLFFGWAGDRWGRRPALIAGMAIIAAGSFASATATDVTTLTAYRFLTGLGLGAPTPLAAALMAEFAPRRWRTVAVALALLGIPLGGMLGAAVAESLIPRYGWPSIFVLGGALPALLTLVLLFAQPESPRWLAGRGDRSVELAKLLNQVLGEARFDGTENFRTSETLAVSRAGTTRLAGLFVPELRNSTILLWCLFFSNVFVVYVFFGWLPTVLTSAGLPLSLAIRESLMFNLGGVVGLLLTATLIGRWGSRAIVVPLSLFAVASTAAIGFAPALSGTPDAAASLIWLTATITLSGLCINGVQIGAYAVATHVYPTHLRATGVGAAASIARLGGIFSSAAGSAMFAAGADSRTFFWGLAAVLVLAFLSIAAIRAHVPRGRGAAG